METAQLKKMFVQKILLNFVILVILRASISQAVGVSEKCTEDEDCDDYDEKTECDDILSICLCNRNHILVHHKPEDPITCEPIRLAVGETCKDKKQCTHGIPGDLSDCVPNTFDGGDSTEKVCHCNDEAVYDPIEKDCYLKRNFIGDDCKVDSQCQETLGNYSYCFFNTECMCHIEAVPNKNGTGCLPIVDRIGGRCEESKQCTEGRPGNWSDCVESPNDPNVKFCSCIDGAKPDLGEHECTKSADGLNGDECRTDKDCVDKIGIHSVCSGTGHCGCLGGYLHSNKTGECIHIRTKLGDSCQESQQCQHGIPGILSACIGGACGCTNFSVNEPDKDFCHRKATLVGDACHINEQCWANLGEKSYCVNEKCECNHDSYPVDDLSKCI